MQSNQLRSFRSAMERQFDDRRAQTAFLMLGWVLPEELVGQLEEVGRQGERELSATLGVMWKSREAEDKATGETSFGQKKFSAIAQGLDPFMRAAATATAAAGEEGDVTGGELAAASSAASGGPRGDSEHGSGRAEEGGAEGGGAAASASAAAAAAASALAAREAHDTLLKNKYSELATYVLQLCGERDGLAKSLVKRERDLEVRRAGRCVWGLTGAVYRRDWGAMGCFTRLLPFFTTSD